MQTEFNKIIPYVLSFEGCNFWGLTRLMNTEPLIQNENSIHSPKRNKPFICKSAASSTRLFYIGSQLTHQAEYAVPVEKFKSILLGQSNESTESIRSIGLASLIVGKCFGIAADTEFINVSSDSNQINKALEYCLNQVIKENKPTVIFFEKTPSPQMWKDCQQIVEKLLITNCFFVAPAANENLENILSVAATDIQEKVLTNYSADVFAPGVGVAAYNPDNHLEPQVLSGNDVAAAFTAGVALLHLQNLKVVNNLKKLFQTNQQTHNKTLPLLWNPYQIFEPTWDSKQDAFLGVYKWGQEIDIELSILNDLDRNFETSFIHNDLPSSLVLNRNRLQGRLPEGKDVYCHHFVAGASCETSTANKMFYLTVTDVPEMLDISNYSNLNIVGKTTISHYGVGDPNPPGFPPFHVIDASCLVGETLIAVFDSRKEVPIDQLNAGDIIQNASGQPSEVIQIFRRTLTGSSLYIINKGLLKLTGCHWVKTTKGTSAILSVRSDDFEGNPVVKLSMGDDLVAESGQLIRIETIEKIEILAPDFQVYNLITMDDNGYIANGIVNVSEIPTAKLFKNKPQFKGQIFNDLFAIRMNNENVRTKFY